MSSKHAGLGGLIAVCALLVACAEGRPPPSSVEPIATIQDLMAAEVDAAADRIWDSVGSVITKDGTTDRQPRTDADWKAVRNDAIILVEATNLLETPRRRVAAVGNLTEDSNTAGVEQPKDIQAAIDADPARFRAAATVLRVAAKQALQAIDGRDPATLIEAGGNIDAACEACHLVYWYPHSPRPP